MANIQEKLNNIKNALFGRDVRDSIHDGIDAINKEVESTTARQVDLESTFDQLVINAGNSNAEIVDARVQSDGTSYEKLGDRLDNFDEQFNTKASINTTNNIQQQVNNLVLGAVGNGNNAEVVQARGIYDVLNDRLNDYEENKIPFAYLTNDFFIKENEFLVKERMNKFLIVDSHNSKFYYTSSNISSYPNGYYTVDDSSCCCYAIDITNLDKIILYIPNDDYNFRCYLTKGGSVASTTNGYDNLSKNNMLGNVKPFGKVLETDVYEIDLETWKTMANFDAKYLAINLGTNSYNNVKFFTQYERRNVKFELPNTRIKPYPAYYDNDVDTYVKQLSYLQKSERLGFVFHTDGHFSKYDNFASIHVANEIVNTLNLDFICNGGDMTDTKENDTNTITREYLFETYDKFNECNTFGNKQINLLGNHELATIMSKSEFCQKSLKNIDNVVYNTNDVSGSYGYIDFDRKKIRCIFLDTSLLNYNGNTSDLQRKWLYEVALNMSGKTGYSVVVMGHEALYPFYYGTGYESLDWGNRPAYRKILSAFHKGKDVIIDDINYNFANQGATPMIYIAGHSHADSSYINPSVDMDFLTITTRDNSIDRSPDHFNSIGTVNECSFDTYVIDAIQKKVIIKRFGLGSDREYTFD